MATQENSASVPVHRPWLALSLVSLVIGCTGGSAASDVPDGGDDSSRSADADPDAANGSRDSATPDAPFDAHVAADSRPADVAPDAAGPTPWSSPIEVCANGRDDDFDGLVDEDCPPKFVGVFPPNGGADFTGDGLVASIEAAAGARISVVQTYRGTSAAGVAAIEPDLGAIWAHGAVAHLNVEPGGYAKSQYATADTDAAIDADLTNLGDGIAKAVAAHPGRFLLLTFGAEMNGGWTDWGCLPAATFIGFYRKAHDRVSAALDAAKVDRRRVRWVYGPNAVSYCGTSAGYFPGPAYADYLGMSSYRHDTATVDEAVVAPARALFDALGWPAEWRRSRFIVLQTGAGAAPDRGAWVTGLFDALAKEPELLGAIWFSADDAVSKWSLVDSAKPLVKRPGFDELAAAVSALPRPDPQLEATFEPYFWDVHRDDEGYPEIQSLRAAGVTAGCETAPPRFCPQGLLTRASAVALLARAFGVDVAKAQGALAGADDPVRRDTLAVALGTLSATPPSASTGMFADVSDPKLASTLEALERAFVIDGCATARFCPADPATRATAARWLAHAIHVAAAPRP